MSASKLMCGSVQAACLEPPAPVPPRAGVGSHKAMAQGSRLDAQGVSQTLWLYTIVSVWSRVIPCCPVSLELTGFPPLIPRMCRDKSVSGRLSTCRSRRAIMSQDRPGLALAMCVLQAGQGNAARRDDPQAIQRRLGKGPREMGHSRFEPQRGGRFPPMLWHTYETDRRGKIRTRGSARYQACRRGARG